MTNKTENKVVEMNVENKVDPRMARKKDKVCIIGFAPSYREAPWGNPEYEFWVLNEFYRVMPEIPNCTVDRWFEIHDPYSKSKSTKEHHDFLKKCTVPLYMQKRYEEFPSSIPFPKDEILKYFEDKNYKGSKYFSNSVSWFIALAIMEGFKSISVFGVDMSTDSEYGWQKPSCEYWCGICEGLGIDLFIPPSSELLKCSQLYAFESNNKLRSWIKAQITELKKRQQQFKQQEIQAQQALHNAQLAIGELGGAISAYNELLKRSQ